ncbi:MAG: hypothetical protein NTX03_03725 [Bacteroidetes bacterium]|nr:hypothetical protein [Bacteroidota bacterium]
MNLFNRNFAYLAFIIAAAFLISSCNNSKHKFKDEATGNGYEITENKHEGNFYLEDIAVKFDASEEGVHGISILYDLKSEKGKGWFGNPFVGMMYDGYIITFTPKDMDGSMGSLDANTLSSFKKVYSRVRDENQEFFIPYFNLPFASGKRKVEFKIQGFPAMTDTNMTSGTREERLKPIRNSVYWGY